MGRNKDESAVMDEELCVGSYKGTRCRDKIPRSDCKIRMSVIKKNNWELTTLEFEHNHEVVTPSKINLIQCERHVRLAARNVIKILNILDTDPSQILSLFSTIKGGVNNVDFGNQHIRNVVRDKWKKRLQVSDT